MHSLRRDKYTEEHSPRMSDTEKLRWLLTRQALNTGNIAKPNHYQAQDTTITFDILISCAVSLTTMMLV